MVITGKLMRRLLASAMMLMIPTLLLAQGLSPMGWAGIGLVVSGVVGVGLTTAREEGAPAPPHVE